MQLVPIPQENLRQAWWAIAPFAEKIAARFPDDWPVPVIAQQAGARELQLWSIFDEATGVPYGCVATRIVIRASGARSCEIAWLAGQERGRWLHLLPVIEEYALKAGCESVTFRERRGWAKDLPDYHVRLVAEYEKPIGTPSSAMEH